MDSNADESWFKDAGEELHTSDFILLTRMQTARRMSQRASRFPGRDMVLERLMAEGTFDRRNRPRIVERAYVTLSEDETIVADESGEKRELRT